MSAQAGWYPDPGGGPGLFRYWDGRAWSAATSPNPAAAPPPQGIAGAAPAGTQPGTGQAYGQQAYGQQAYGQQGGGYGSTPASAYAGYQQGRKKSPVGWWIIGAVLVLVIIIVSVVALRAVTGGTSGVGIPGSQSSQDTCPPQQTDTAAPAAPADGRVHGGPLSFPRLGSPWGAPEPDDRVPFGSDVQSQNVAVQPNYQFQKSWVASILVGELQAGDGFFTPEQGSQIVVKCILGEFYDDNPVTSAVQVNEAATIDGHEAWIVESQLSFDIEGLDTKGELLIVAIVSNGATSGLYYASIPDTVPELVQPARNALKNLQVDG